MRIYIKSTYLVFLFLLINNCNNVSGDSPLFVNMISPKYRNAIYSTMPDPNAIKFRIKIELSQQVLNQTSMDILLRRNSTVIKTYQFSNLSTYGIYELSVDDVNFQNTRSGPYIIDDNPYEFVIELRDGDNNILDIEIIELNKYPLHPNGVNEVRIDDDDNLLINGEPIFLIGSYSYSPYPENYDALKNYGFNAVRSTSQNYDSLFFLAKAQFPDTNYLKNWVTTYRSASQTVAWYLHDEPITVGFIDDEDLRARYEIVRRMDPYHPAGWVDVIIWQPGDGNGLDWRDYEGCHDFIMIDNYPCFDNYTYLYNIARQFSRVRFPEQGGSTFEFVDVPLWGVPQMFELNAWRQPEPNEEKNMVYQYVSLGAKSLFTYIYGVGNWGTSDISLWNYWRDTLIVELRSIESALFALRKSGTSIPFPENQLFIQTSDPDILVWSFRKTTDKEYIFLINTSNYWNKPLGAQVPGPKDRRISIAVTFNSSGSNELEAIIRDPNTPFSYTLENNTISLELDGVNSTSSGVLVLSRDININNSTKPSTPTRLKLLSE